MVRVKVCGITRLEDAMTAVEAGADALGFIFVEETPRFVTPERVAPIVAALPPFVTPVGVFWDHPAGPHNAVPGGRGVRAPPLHARPRLGPDRRGPHSDPRTTVSPPASSSFE